MKKPTIVIGVVVAALLAACAPVATPDAPGQGVVFKSDASRSFVAGYAPVDVAITKNNTAVTTPVTCQIDSSKYATSVSAPATVSLPAYTQGAVPVRVVCTYEEKTYAATFEPVNLSKRARTESSIAVGVLLCPICGIAIAASNASNENERVNDLYGFEKFELKL